MEARDKVPSSLAAQSLASETRRKHPDVREVRSRHCSVNADFVGMLRGSLYIGSREVVGNPTLVARASNGISGLW
ncbi:hypothetical protein BD414DRAFT_495503 [Trametes punicea]|nr:hypothetical protein BD414DRAFT_495503 [Trametes punicea]